MFKSFEPVMLHLQKEAGEIPGKSYSVRRLIQPVWGQPQWQSGRLWRRCYPAPAPWRQHRHYRGQGCAGRALGRAERSMTPEPARTRGDGLFTGLSSQSRHPGPEGIVHRCRHRHHHHRPGHADGGCGGAAPLRDRTRVFDTAQWTS